MRGEPTFAQIERRLLSNLEEAARSVNVPLALAWLAYFCDEAPQPDPPVYDAISGIVGVLNALVALDAFRAEPRWTTPPQPDTF